MMPARTSSPVHPVENEAEATLIRRIRNGEPELFYELIKPYERRVYAATYAILRNEADAEDAAQEAVLKAFKNFRQFREEARFSTWLIQIAVNEARMRRRREHPDVMEPLADQRDEDGSYVPRDFADWREIPSEALERRELRDVLQKALSMLPEKYRTVLVLRDVQQRSIAETAAILGIREENVKTRTSRARLQMRDLLARDWGRS